MNEPHSKWLTKELSETFSEGVRGAVPGANLQLEIITKLISVWRPSPSTILDLGSGDGILGRMLLLKYPTAHTVFADFSEPMLAKVRQKVSDSKMATVIQIDFATPDWINAINAQTPVISEIFDSFFLESIRCSLPNPDQNEMMNQIEKAYYDDKKENIPAPVEQQCKWLRSIGFKEVDCFFKTFELALFGGIKTSTKANSADEKSRAAD